MLFRSMGELNSILGTDVLPDKVSASVFNDLLAEDKSNKVFFRGVNAPEQAQAFIDGKFYPGMGFYGNGT